MTPPKVRYTKERIIDEAYNLVEEKGIHQLTARNIAKKLNMSLAPIYNSFKSMDHLTREIIKKGKAQLLDYTRAQHTDRIFLNIGTGIVLFARDHPNIYKAIFIEGGEYRHVVDEIKHELGKQMAKDPRFTDMAVADRVALLEKMWIFTHGLASLTFAKLVKKTAKEDIIETLVEMGAIVITAALSPANKRESRADQVNKLKGGKK